MDVQSFVGREVNFDCQPYNRGRGRIARIENCDGMWAGYHLIEVEVIEGKTRNRLFQHVSHTPMATGQILRMYHYRPEELEKAVNEGRTLIYVYPV